MLSSKQILSASDKLDWNSYIQLCASPNKNTSPSRIILVDRGEIFNLKARIQWEILQEGLYSTQGVHLEAIIP